MKKEFLIITIIMVGLTFISCSEKTIRLTDENLDVVNRYILSIDEDSNTVSLNAKLGDGFAIIENVNFDIGTIELELKGENNPGKSFLGIAFNVQNDSTYEAIYFRPFNFQSGEKIRREHSVQYIHEPKHTWRFLRTNYTGQFEAEYPSQPSPDEWFGIQIKIDPKKVYVYDIESNTELLSVERLGKQVSNKIALWTGNNSKGDFGNLKIMN